MHEQAVASTNPAARIYAHDKAALRHLGQVPLRRDHTGSPSTSTTGRSTCNAAVLQPEQFVEIGEALAKEKGIRNGEKIRVRSNRGRDRREGGGDEADQAAHRGGKTIHTVGIPIHWGFEGLANRVPRQHAQPFVGDANVQTPEFKAFIVNVEKLSVA